MASSKCPSFKHATTSNSGTQLLYNCVALACLKGILCHKKIENFSLVKICIPEKSLI